MYMYQKKETQFSAKNEPSFVTIKCCDGSYTCRNYFRRNNMQILKLAAYKD